jgi:hypothetical protein
MHSSPPTKPAAIDQETEDRWTQNSLRYRLLTGQWITDLEQELQRHFNSERRAVIGIPDMSSNVFAGVTKALTSLYTEAPSIQTTGPAEELLARDGIIHRAGLWPIMQRVQLYTVGLREMFLHVGLNSTNTGLVYRPVSPDWIYATAPRNNPMEPNFLMELRLRLTEDNDYLWTYDVYDLRDTANPEFKIVEAKNNGDIGQDVSDQFGGGAAGAAYPYRLSDGIPILPYSIYHAELTGDRLFDSFTNAELIAGSLVSASLHSYLIHLTRDCAFPLRWSMGADLAGGSVFDANGASRRVAISADPSSIICFSPDPEMQGLGQPMLGQFSAGADPEQLLNVITLYERKLAQSAGISPGSVQKLSGDPRSGYAIAMSKSDQRDSQRRAIPAMTRGDSRTLQISAVICNRFLGKSFPEFGYQINYHSIPMNKEELASQRQDLIEKMEKGLITKIDAIQTLYPDLSREEAAEYLREIKRQQIEFPA